MATDTRVKLLTDFDAAVGKTVEAIVPLGGYPKLSEIAFRFTDGSFLVLDIDHGYDGDSEIEILERPGDLTDDAQFKAGLIDKAEHDRREQVKRDREAARQERIELDTYNRLRAKYDKQD